MIRKCLGCLLFGSSPGEGEKMGVDPSFDAYNNLCWMEETTKSETERSIHGNDI